eukprot:c13887_g1_i1.p1 GENE.c13887_g1_i1~~c13887_g1_i1.p1  ORF type:complete len:155 (-),score=32.34 c13887_g1_i1:219-623(-)
MYNSANKLRDLLKKHTSNEQFTAIMMEIENRHSEHSRQVLTNELGHVDEDGVIYGGFGGRSNSNASNSGGDVGVRRSSDHHNQHQSEADELVRVLDRFTTFFFVGSHDSMVMNDHQHQGHAGGKGARNDMNDYS